MTPLQIKSKLKNLTKSPTLSNLERSFHYDNTIELMWKHTSEFIPEQSIDHIVFQDYSRGVQLRLTAGLIPYTM